MGRSSRRSVVLALLAVVLASCSSDGKSAPSTVPPPAASAVAEPAEGTTAFGEPAVLGELTITARDPLIESDESGPWLTITVRADNSSVSDVPSPTFELRCAGSAAGGAWLTSSTFDQQDPVPYSSFKEGTVSLLLPGDEHPGGPRQPCATPATVVATILAFDAAGAGQPKPQRVEWVVPDALVDELNAAAAGT
ncbi:MAG TPA: hypothetical protein VH761_12570 [Ilumatobacteraceae bacterium]|jgi:hypothetical protein